MEGNFFIEEKRKHSKLGVASFIIFLVSIVLLILFLIISLVFEGLAISMIGSLVGVILSIISLGISKLENKRVIFSILGLILNSLYFLFFLSVGLLGFFMMIYWLEGENHEKLQIVWEYPL